MQEQLNKIALDLAPLAALVADVKSIKSELSGLKDSIEMAHDLINGFSVKVKSLESKVTKMEKMADQISTLQDGIDKLNQESRDRDQWARANNAEIIDEATARSRHKFGRNVRRDKVRRVNRANVRRSPVRQDDYDRSPVEFDVASFIQPETDNLETDEVFMGHKNNKRRWNENKPFDIGSMMKNDDINNKLEKSPDYISMGDSLPDLNISPPLTKDLLNAKHFGYNPLEDLNAGKYGHEKFRNIYKDDLLLNQNMVHNQEKKCSLKAIKFPFFSHNKSEVLKPKKTKKRKLFFFNNSKKEVVKVPDFNKMSDDTMIPYKIKRSYEQRLCPACKKIFVATMDHERPKKRNPSKIIHNSRQYYQNALPDATLKEEIKDFRTSKISNADDRYRMKRHDRERQLKELEEVQKKVDAVEIRVPQLNKPSEKDNT
ncbi:hypothetical protein PYW07_012008 [Mythimna separata]|uniref:Uncharacterized protein n=1 Tax=Mythimna separata TaxID=271217 RepID=A0AAD7YMI4_MYTSE|nr:hypothetical protein PYW07_012008 [Mythimna separata]